MSEAGAYTRSSRQRALADLVSLAHEGRGGILLLPGAHLDVSRALPQHLWTISDTPIYSENLDDLPSRQLKRKVDRLEALLRGLAGLPPPPEPAKLTPPTTCSLPVPDSPPLAVPQRPSSAPGSVETVVPPSPTMDERARSEACKALIRAFLSDEHVLDEPVLGIDPSALSAQLRAVGTCHLTAFPAHRVPNPASLHDTLSADDYRQTVEAVLPTRAQAEVALEAYLASGNSVLRLLNPQTFLQQCEAYWTTGRVPEPNWLATYLIACASGLFGLDRLGEASQEALPTGAPQELLARTWADAGRRVLSANSESRASSPACEGLLTSPRSQSSSSSRLSKASERSPSCFPGGPPKAVDTSKKPSPSAPASSPQPTSSTCTATQTKWPRASLPPRRTPAGGSSGRSTSSSPWPDPCWARPISLSTRTPSRLDIPTKLSKARRPLSDPHRTSSSPPRRSTPESRDSWSGDKQSRATMFSTLWTSSTRSSVATRTVRLRLLCRGTRITVCIASR